MPTPPTAYDETAKGPGLSGLLEILRRRRVLAVLPFLFVLTAAVSLAVFLPSLWTSRALVLVNRQAIPERYVTPTVQADIEARLLTLSQDILTPQRLTQIAQHAPSTISSTACARTSASSWSTTATGGPVRPAHSCSPSPTPRPTRWWP